MSDSDVEQTTSYPYPQSIDGGTGFFFFKMLNHCRVFARFELTLSIRLLAWCNYLAQLDLPGGQSLVLERKQLYPGKSFEELLSCSEDNTSSDFKELLKAILDRDGSATRQKVAVEITSLLSDKSLSKEDITTYLHTLFKVASSDKIQLSKGKHLSWILKICCQDTSIVNDNGNFKTGVKAEQKGTLYLVYLY